MTPARFAILAAMRPEQDAVTGTGFFREIGAFARQLIVAAFDPYRPEQHYMRGPGPACRASMRSRGVPDAA